MEMCKRYGGGMGGGGGGGGELRWTPFPDAACTTASLGYLMVSFRLRILTLVN